MARLCKNVISGQTTGTGADISLNIGAVPSAVLVFNITDGNMGFWDNSMTSGYIAKENGVATSGGITPLTAAGPSTSRGFKIGTDTDINVSGSLLKYLAFY